MKLIGEFFSLALLRLKVSYWNFKEEQKVEKTFYSHKLFACVDKQLKKTYRFRSPFVISRRFLQSKGEVDVHCYGETPITTLDFLAKECSLSSADHVIELGCGRGRGLFFLSAFYRCKVSGVEWIPEFVLRAYDLSKRFPVLNVSFFLSDMTQVSFENASVIYLNGVCLSDVVIERLADKMKRLPITTKIITVSYPLTDYRPSDFIIQKTLQADFNWGKTEIFIQTPRSFFKSESSQLV